MRIKTITLLFAALLVFFFFTGCDRAEQKSSTPPASPRPQVETTVPATPSLPEITEEKEDDIVEPEHGDVVDTTDDELDRIFEEGTELELELLDGMEEAVELLDIEEVITLDDLEETEVEETQPAE